MTTITDQMSAVENAFKWASGLPVVWKNKADSPRVREPNRAWVELQVLSLRSIGTDEIRESEGTDATNPRVENMCAHREMRIQAKFRSRSQEHVDTAWAAGIHASMRINARFARSKWYRDSNICVISASEIIDVPDGLKHDNRIEDVAILETVFGIAINETDAAMVGTYIEHVEVTSALKNPGGVALDASLQLNKEVMP